MTDFFETITVEEQLSNALDDMVRDFAAEAPRSRQAALGPSEVGHPCARRLAYGMMREPRSNAGGDPLPSVVGTAAHTWMEAAALAANKRLGRTRWLSEMRVTVRGSLSGSCDLTDLDTMTIIDHKFPGNNRMQIYKRKGPTITYRRQVHLYGRGMRNIGVPIERVAINMLPRGGQLSSKILWSEPYSDEIVEETLQRMDDVALSLDSLDVEQHPERYALIPITPDSDCVFCKWYSSRPSGPYQCDGKLQAP